jgi:SPP1 gp7 family putative phage head morphogenesis protein
MVGMIRKTTKNKNQKGLQGSQLRYNAGLLKKISEQNQALMTLVIEETEKTVKQIFRSYAAREFFTEDSYESSKEVIAGVTMSNLSVTTNSNRLFRRLRERIQKRIDERADNIASNMVNLVLNDASASVNRSIKSISKDLSINSKNIPQPLKDMIKASSNQAASLIKILGDSHVDQIQNAVLRSIVGGRGLEDLIPYMQHRRGITLRKARNDALDQTRKVYAGVYRMRMRQAGIDKFIWVHSGGSQDPRPLHRDKLNGQIFSIDDPPIIDEKTGERGYPGDAINCRCFMRPVIKLEGEEE